MRVLYCCTATYGAPVSIARSVLIFHSSDISKPGYYRSCALVKGSGKFKVTISVRGGLIKESTYDATSSYANYCTDWNRFLQAKEDSDGTDNIMGSRVYLMSPALINVRSITIERKAQDVNTGTPQPAPVK